MQRRVVIENVTPQVDGGLFAVKRCVGDVVAVHATIFADGIDPVEAVVKVQSPPKSSLAEIPLKLINPGKDLWEGRFPVEKIGDYVFMIEAWAGGKRSAATQSGPWRVQVERSRARTGAWYEFFPRSAGNSTERGATLREAAERLDYVANLGFDVAYLPPVHPIGRSFRKGPNNSVTSKPSDPGSPWGIGASEGGHKAVDPNLGTLDDFDYFVQTATKRGLDVALDLAYQCSPDHPYVREHPEWFYHRPDGTIRYAENPPKKYEDIYPLNFECDEWKALWEELKSVVTFWAKHGVRIFRVDNPHTKPFRFWEWMIREVQTEFPDVVFLAEAFTRPAVMQYLAKVGFSQSYTYFTWRNNKTEITDYLTELTQPPVSEFMRPNFFANTPDILHDYLQNGGVPAFKIRLILAATLAASYGIYGPLFELGENKALPGTEDYLDSEKYQIRQWDWQQSTPLRGLIRRVNQIRHDNPALHLNTNLRFYPIDNPNMLCYVKITEDGANRILVVINLDPRNEQSGWLEFPIDGQVHDLLTDAQFNWNGPKHFVKLNPHEQPAHILRI